jgi:hypothetical protein
VKADLAAGAVGAPNASPVFEVDSAASGGAVNEKGAFGAAWDVTAAVDEDGPKEKLLELWPRANPEPERLANDLEAVPKPS